VAGREGGRGGGEELYKKFLFFLRSVGEEDLSVAAARHITSHTLREMWGTDKQSHRKEEGKRRKGRDGGERGGGGKGRGGRWWFLLYETLETSSLSSPLPCRVALC
jgi:hypothetical protein